MKSKAAKARPVDTQERILDAAVVLFSRRSYEKTGLRDIAAAAGVDVAHVHRSFGSKERLFGAAVRATLQAERMLAGSKSSMARDLAHEVFLRDGTRRSDEVGPLDIMIRSLSSPEASRVLREAIHDDFIVPLADKLGHRTHRQAGFITALLAGIGIFRIVLRIESMVEAEGGEFERQIARTIRSLM